jgi:ABC-type transport system involved in cytochrome c biogenesis permease subunit
LQGLRGGTFSLGLATFVVGFLLALVGLFQKSWLPEPNTNHWIIQVIHLILGLAAIGLGERVAGWYRRLAAKPAA